MRELLQNLTSVPLSISPEPNIPAVTGGGGSGFLWWLLDCHGLLFNLALIVPSTIFVAYLSSQARKSFAKLTYGRSYIMIAYYVLLWVVSVLNLLRCFLQVRKPFLISHLPFYLGLGFDLVELVEYVDFLLNFFFVYRHFCHCTWWSQYLDRWTLVTILDLT